MEPTTNEAGEEVFQVTVTYEGTDQSIDAKREIKVLTAPTSPFEKLELPAVLMQGYVSRDKHPTLVEMRAEALSEKDKELTGATSWTPPG